MRKVKDFVIWSKKDDDLVYKVIEWTKHPLGEHEVLILKEGEPVMEAMNFHVRSEAEEFINKYEASIK